MSGNGISWAICKSVPRSRQATTPAPHHSVYTGLMPFLLPNQQRQSTEGQSVHAWKSFTLFSLPVSHAIILHRCNRMNYVIVCRFVSVSRVWKPAQLLTTHIGKEPTATQMFHPILHCTIWSTIRTYRKEHTTGVIKAWKFWQHLKQWSPIGRVLCTRIALKPEDP